MAVRVAGGVALGALAVVALPSAIFFRVGSEYAQLVGQGYSLIDVPNAVFIDHPHTRQPGSLHEQPP